MFQASDWKKQLTSTIFFQPTKLFDWEPDPYYNLTEVEHHPTMPQNVKNNISIDTIQCFEKKKI